MKRLLILHSLGISSLLLYGFWFTSVPLANDSAYIVSLGLVTAVLFLLYGAILWFTRKWYQNNHGWSHTKTIIVYALVVRVILLLANPGITPLSDDVYRYVWEGKLVANGYNPYTISPESMSGSGLTDSIIYPKINHPDLPTIYPPLAQFLFAATWKVAGDSLVGFRTLSFLFELAALFLIIVMVREFKLPEWTSLIYAFSPLVLIEFGFSSHLDILGLPFLIAALISLRRQKPLTTGIFLALAVMIKLVAVIFIPLLLFHFVGRKRLILLSGFVAVCLLGYLPFFISAGWELFGSLWVYLGRWEHNGSLFTMAQSIANSATARAITGGLFVTIAGIIALRTERLGNTGEKNRIPPLRAMFLTFASYLLLSATVYPWYLIWLLPFLLLYRDRAFLTFTGTVFISYHILMKTYHGAFWTNNGLLLVIEYLPVYALLLWNPLKEHFDTPPQRMRIS